MTFSLFAKDNVEREFKRNDYEGYHEDIML